MATVTKIFQRSLSHRAPLIQFRYGLEHKNFSSTNQTKANVTQPKNTTPSPSKSAKKTIVFEFNQTPKKYRRRPLTQDEIDLVTIGGRP